MFDGDDTRPRSFLTPLPFFVGVPNVVLVPLPGNMRSCYDDNTNAFSILPLPDRDAFRAHQARRPAGGAARSGSSLIRRP